MSPPPTSTAPVPIATSLPPQFSTTTTTRRPSPQCWSADETVALIDAYRSMWYALNRGNLRGMHWAEVAEAVPGKTVVQCRHKMEKLRKRYRTEMERARLVPVEMFRSGWVHFRMMDDMENGVKVEDGGLCGNVNFRSVNKLYGNGVKVEGLNGNVNLSSSHKLYGNSVGIVGEDEGVIEIVGGGGNEMRGKIMGCGGGGIRGEIVGGGRGRIYSSGGGGFRISTGVSLAQPGSRIYGRIDDQNPPPYGRVVGESSVRPMFGKRKREEKEKVKDGMVGAIKKLGDGFLRVEKMKMDMAKEIEMMRMEMEMERTQMILEFQQKIVEAFVNAVVEKKAKKMKVPTKLAYRV